MSCLSIIVPIYNEKKYLEEVFRYFMEQSFRISVEWIFVDDFSKDGSRELLQDLAQQYQTDHDIRVLLQDKNRGKGAAIRRALAGMKGDYVVIQDADFEYDPREIDRLLVPVVEGRADVVYGSRFKDSSPQVHRTYHYFINRILTLLSNLFSGIYLTDMETCYKLFRSDLIRAMRLRSQRFGFEIEVTAYLAKIRPRIFELPVSYYPRNRLQGKKIGLLDGIAALFHLLRFNFFVSRQSAFKDLPQSYLGSLPKSNK